MDGDGRGEWKELGGGDFFSLLRINRRRGEELAKEGEKVET